MLNSLNDVCITRVAAVNSFLRVLNPGREAYIYIYIYIFIDASGWVISDVSFGFMGGFGSCNLWPSHPNDPVGIDLTPTPIPAANLRIHIRKKITTEMALYIILQQPIRAKLYWWLLNLSFKNREATLLLLFGCNDVIIRLFVHSGVYFSLFPSFPLSFFFFFSSLQKKKYIYAYVYICYIAIYEYVKCT